MDKDSKVDKDDKDNKVDNDDEVDNDCNNDDKLEKDTKVDKDDELDKDDEVDKDNKVDKDDKDNKVDKDDEVDKDNKVDKDDEMDKDDKVDKDDEDHKEEEEDMDKKEEQDEEFFFAKILKMTKYTSLPNLVRLGQWEQVSPYFKGHCVEARTYFKVCLVSMINSHNTSTGEVFTDTTAQGGSVSKNLPFLRSFWSPSLLDNHWSMNNLLTKVGDVSKNLPLSLVLRTRDRGRFLLTSPPFVRRLVPDTHKLGFL